MTAPIVVDPVATRPVARGLVGAVALPLLVASAAFSLWWVSDRLVDIGPFDRATFGWAVVVPVWFATPFASALAWRGLPRRTGTIAAATLGLVVGGVAAILVWQANAFPSCQFGPNRGAEAWIWPSIAIGATVGGGLAASSIIAARGALAGRYVVALASGAAGQAAFLVVAILTFGSIALAMPSCARP